MAVINTRRDLHAWRESMTLVEIVYRATENFPKVETFGLVSQIRRCAISVPSNTERQLNRAGRIVRALRKSVRNKVTA